MNILQGCATLIQPPWSGPSFKQGHRRTNPNRNMYTFRSSPPGGVEPKARSQSFCAAPAPIKHSRGLSQTCYKLKQDVEKTHYTTQICRENSPCNQNSTKTLNTQNRKVSTDKLDMDSLKSRNILKTQHTCSRYQSRTQLLLTFVWYMDTFGRPCIMLFSTFP